MLPTFYYNKYRIQKLGIKYIQPTNLGVVQFNYIMQYVQYLFIGFVMTLIRKISWAPNQHIRMISEGLCETEAWSNDAENSTFPSQE